MYEYLLLFQTNYQILKKNWLHNFYFNKTDLEADYSSTLTIVKAKAKIETKKIIRLLQILGFHNYDYAINI